LYRHTPIPFTRRAILGWIFIACIALFQILGFVTPGDRRATLEGNRFGMFMFEANHQCAAEVTVYRPGKSVDPYVWEAPAGTPCSGFFCVVKRETRMDGDASAEMSRHESATAWSRCDPYEWWARLHTQCERDPAVSRIAFTFDHSVNGGPFYRIVDAENICDLDYRLFRHNEWIRMTDEATVVGYPVQNTYHY
jgi:hypothetical protein